MLLSLRPGVRLVLSALGLLVGILAAPPAEAAEDDATPGLVAEKPAEGRFVETDEGFLVPYTVTIPGTEATFQMEPIPGGVFRFGSPADEAGRNDDEGPTAEVRVPPGWMARTEVTWAEYKEYMKLHDLFKKFQSQGVREVTDDSDLDAITAPSNLYDPSFTFQSGEDPQQPALSMTQYAAKQYTKWLSAVTGEFYRLPSEAEWEYACRAGAQTAYSFGDDPADLADYGWFVDNSDDVTQIVAQKQPNAWGLYDMHGNVGEWVLDEYADAYPEREGPVASADAVVWPTKVFPRVIRGGSFLRAAEECRSASRLPSEDIDWKDSDPNLPLSPWWFTSYDGLAVGFRLYRPLTPPADREEREKYWRADHEEIQLDVDYRIEQEGRGARGLVDPELPAAIEGLTP